MIDCGAGAAGHSPAGARPAGNCATAAAASQTAPPAPVPAPRARWPAPPPRFPARPFPPCGFAAPRSCAIAVSIPGSRTRVPSAARRVRSIPGPAHSWDPAGSSTNAVPARAGRAAARARGFRAVPTTARSRAVFPFAAPARAPAGCRL